MTVLAQRRSTAPGHTGSVPAAGRHPVPAPQQRIGRSADRGVAAVTAGSGSQPGSPSREEYQNAGPDVFWAAPLGDRGAA